MGIFKNYHNSSRDQKQLGGCGGVAFGLFWTAFSSIFVIVGLYASFSGVKQSQWPTAECALQEFSIDAKRNADPPFQPKVHFTYQWNGQEYSSSKVWADKQGEDDYQDLTDLLEAHRNEELTTCFVNPDNPSEAVLLHEEESIWFGIAFALFGLFFVLIGVGILVTSLRGSKSKKQALSSKKNEEAGKAILIPFFGIFALAGLAVLIFFVLPMWQKYLSAKSWEPTSATVIWSTVRSHSDSDGTTYSPDIFYRYQYNGHTYQSNSVGLMGGSSSGRDSKQELVNAYPRKHEFTCFVNPNNPYQALIQRDIGWWAAFTLFPLPFIAVGFGGLIYTFKKQKSKKTKVSHANAKHFHQTTSAHSQEFRPTKKRLGWILGAFLIAAFWNGIVSVFFLDVWNTWQKGDPDWFLTLFLTPFVLVGLGMILHFFYRIMAACNAAPTLTLKPASITLDTPARLYWKTLRGEHKVAQFQIYLIGEEEARYQRGTNTVTDTSIFHESLLTETSDPRKIRRGEIEIILPQDTMPSWEGSNNAIKWYLRVRGDIKLWPDIKDDYLITVLPPHTPES
ncbi:DUF3592 domain-containing protein [Rubritalea tangerina]|uniref:DUF3592 domain-containing protein n=1 Tax=Rubritalea tangerina TaxID=430798 RepID=A0ABW4ZC56_9BACT